MHDPHQLLDASGGLPEAVPRTAFHSPGDITPVVSNGYLHPSDKPGWGIELDEKAAARYPAIFHLFDKWVAQVRKPDGGLEAP